MIDPRGGSVTPVWREFSRSYVPSWSREASGQVIQPVGTHAFLGEASRSVCTRVERARAGDPATPEAIEIHAISTAFWDGWQECEVTDRCNVKLRVAKTRGSSPGIEVRPRSVERARNENQDHEVA